ncbi:purple acid phosphatase [Bacteroidia bacterium]|nr:purple acid phosphatase [Bacteroidia bacterium]
MVPIITALVVLTLVLFCRKRWGGWFGNPVEPAYTSLSVPGRIQLTFGNSGEFSRNISWQCGDTLAPSKVVIVKVGSLDTLHIAATGKVLRSTGGTTVSYHAQLKSLEQGIYRYRVQTGRRQSPEWQFVVRDPHTDFSFIYIGDIQDTLHSFTKPFFANIFARHPQAHFWLLGGDVIERPHDQYWNEYFTSMDSITQTTPFIAAPGNHEYLKGVPSILEERFLHVFSYFLENSARSGANTSTNGVFALRYGNTAIITLDSNKDFWTYLSQRAWLKEALKRAETARWKIVVLHHPLYSIHGKMTNLMVRALFGSLLKENGVDLVLQGHEHGYARAFSKADDESPTTPVYMISNASPKDYMLYFNDKYNRYGNGMRFEQHIRVQQDTLDIKTFTEYNELYDEIRIIKGNDSDKVAGPRVTTYTDNIPEHLEINERTKKMKDKKRKKYEQAIEMWLQR